VIALLSAAERLLLITFLALAFNVVFLASVLRQLLLASAKGNFFGAALAT
jgi:hypothetical protein